MIKLIKRTIFRILPLASYLRILQQSYFFSYRIGLLKFSRNYDYHYYVKKLIRKGDTIIDIGANLGYYSILFSRWTGENGKVLSVEPIQIYNQVFNKKAKNKKNIQLFPYALGTEEKTVQLVSSPHTGYLRTGLPHIYDSSKDGELANQEFTFDTEMKQASKLFKDLEKIDYIKCDIEGFEFVVLSEMKELILKHRPKIQVEVWAENEASLLSFFEEMNYTPYKVLKTQLIEQEKGKKPLQGDYIFISNRHELSALCLR
jgi:methyltransferase, FkbM family